MCSFFIESMIQTDWLLELHKYLLARDCNFNPGNHDPCVKTLCFPIRNVFLESYNLRFFLDFFFGIKLPNRVPLNHPINEAATKTLTFSVILFELPSEHCACGHGFIGFAEPMSPLRFMHTHSYLRPPTIQRLCAGQCPLHWAGCSEEWTTIACSMTDVVTGDTRKIFLIGTGPITVLQGTRSYFLLSQGLPLFLCLRRRRDTTIALAFGATF